MVIALIVSDWLMSDETFLILILMAPQEEEKRAKRTKPVVFPMKD